MPPAIIHANAMMVNWVSLEKITRFVSACAVPAVRSRAGKISEKEGRDCNLVFRFILSSTNYGENVKHEARLAGSERSMRDWA